MKKDLKILLSSYNGRDILISHFGLINVGQKSSQQLLDEMYLSFHNHIIHADIKGGYVICRYMFINSNKKLIEYIDWKGWPGYTPKSRRFQTELFWYKPEVGVKYKTMI